MLAGAAAILVDGLVAGRARSASTTALDVPVVGLPPAVAASVRSALARGSDVHGVARRARLAARTSGSTGVAPFSSHGLAFGGGVKPEVVAPGVELVTADPGRNEDQTARYGTISGTSAAAARRRRSRCACSRRSRPGLDAAALKGALVGTAAGRRRAPTAAQGAGVVDAGGGECGRGDRGSGGASASALQTSRAGRPFAGVTVRNVSTRRVTVEVAAAVEGIAGVSVVAKPTRLRLPPGAQSVVTLTARVVLRPAQARRSGRGGHGSTSRAAA